MGTTDDLAPRCGLIVEVNFINRQTVWIVLPRWVSRVVAVNDVVARGNCGIHSVLHCRVSVGICRWADREWARIGAVVVALENDAPPLFIVAFAITIGKGNSRQRHQNQSNKKYVVPHGTLGKIVEHVAYCCMRKVHGTVCTKVMHLRAFLFHCGSTAGSTHTAHSICCHYDGE
ncbi:hypothetical protein HRbin20_00201 [bacterium HR20]|nr:hypothetical protein HRbin20_00201 [bacterium HR20]